MLPAAWFSEDSASAIREPTLLLLGAVEILAAREFADRERLAQDLATERFTARLPPAFAPVWRQVLHDFRRRLHARMIRSERPRLPTRLL